LWTERIDGIDAPGAALALASGAGLAWLDSQSDAPDGRYSFLANEPVERHVVRFGAKAPFSAFPSSGLDRTRNALGPDPSGVPRWIGYIAYDAAWSNPTRGTARFERGERPVVLFHRYDAVLAIDHQEGHAWLLGDDADACARLRRRLSARGMTEPLGFRVDRLEADDPAAHRQAIERALAYIADGDVYEVNLARRWTARFEGSALALWFRMREASQVPLGMFLDAGDHSVLACTMERFLRWEAQTGRLVTRPIKGTVRRLAGDEGAEARLLADPKERAEHSMIVDLMRNDLGRVARVGTVRVEAPLRVEPFTGLYHLVSTVACETRAGVSATDVLEASFPPGSITGAPKLRAMEIIESLERHPRGVYCGAVGFIDRAGGLSLAVSIRTATVRAPEVEYWAGGGIVEASDPDRELAETELKAHVFLDAIGGPSTP
jgi:para-aminobenzoate synthetase component 1